MLGLALGSHPLIQVIDEPWSYTQLSGGRFKDRDGRTDTVTGYKIPRWSDLLLHESARDIDQPRSYRWRYDRQPVVFLVRRPVDVVASILTTRTRGGWWADAYLPPLVASRLSRYSSAVLPESGTAALPWRAKVDPRWRAVCLLERSLTSFGRKPPVERRRNGLLAAGAVYWLLKNEPVVEYVRSGLPIHIVSYERLVAAPGRVLGEILDRLQLPWDSAVLRHESWAGRQGTDEQGLVVGGTDPGRAIDTTSVGRAAQVLTPEAIAFVDGVCRELFEEIIRLEQAS
jgi:hypothetical protein